jgi:Na+-transporting methylmalonyl-CoA/oxaloacetate decarboxylase gamma subunit
MTDEDLLSKKLQRIHFWGWDEGAPLSKKLPLIYFWGWVVLAPLIILIALIWYVSYKNKFEALLDGLWIGILNLGILWTAVFLLIVVVSSIAHILRTGDRQPQQVVVESTFWEEFWWIYRWGWIVTISLGFLSEFLAGSFGVSGGLMVTVALAFLPMTLATALIAYVRSLNK